jgi:hypothetical protein
MSEYRLQKYLCGVEFAENIRFTRKQTFLSLPTTTVHGLKTNHVTKRN